ncbi:hypothetical protein CEB3_c33890 [Peptococcaceae bacterium CEB3]|nr:hypothetical protein CEB3_c33890 [Peptococcaceae bacterium CEB3]
MMLNESNQELDFDKLLNSLPIFHELIPYAVTAVVVDSNILLGDLRRMLLTGKLTTLFKLAEAKRVVIFFPAESIHEIEDHFSKMARESRTTVNEVREKWNHTYARLIRLVPDLKPRVTAPLENDLRDPKDIPFLRLVSFMSHEWFLTQDKDLLALGMGNENYVDLSLDLRGYHAGQSIMYTFSACETVITLTGLVAISAFYDAIRALYHLIKNLPNMVRLLGVVIIIATFMLPKSREFIKGICLTALPMRIKEVRDGLVPILLPIFDYLETGKTLKLEGMEKLQKYHRSNPTTDPRTAKDYIFAVLSKSAVPLSVDQIAQRVKNEGYVTTNQGFAKYVPRILRSESTFSQVDAHKWILGVVCGVLE